MSFVNLNRKGAIKAAALAVGIAGITGSANAAFTYDLRFADGTTTRAAAPGQYVLTAYAIVSGADGNTGNEGVSFGFLNMASQQIGGGSVATGGVTGAANIGNFANAGRPGAPAVTPITNDNLQDWGNTAPLTTGATNSSPPQAMLWRANGSPPRQYSNTSGQASTVVPGAWEWAVGQFTVTIGSLGGGGSTRFALLVNDSVSGSSRSAQWVEDGDPAVPATGQKNGDGDTNTVVPQTFPIDFSGAFVEFTGSVVTPTTFVRLEAAGTGTDLGDAFVTGSGNSFSGTVLDVADSASGYVDIFTSIGNAAFVNVAPGNPTLVLLDLEGGSLPADANLGGATATTSGGEFAILNSIYGGGFDVLLTFPTGLADFSFDFGTSGTVLDRLVVVPEPSALGLVGLAGAAALRRRRA